MKQTQDHNDTIVLSFRNSLDGISLPLIRTEKNGYPVYFLVDTGANKNYIRRDCLSLPEINDDTIMLDDMEEFYGIDNVCHQATTCNFRFNVGPHEYMEKYQVIEDGAALTFPLANDSVLHVAGILGTPFLMKYNALIDFVKAEIYFNIPAECKSGELSDSHVA